MTHYQEKCTYSHKHILLTVLKGTQIKTNALIEDGECGILRQLGESLETPRDSTLRITDFTLSSEAKILGIIFFGPF